MTDESKPFQEIIDDNHPDDDTLDLENSIDVEENDDDDNLEVPNDTVPIDEGGD